VDAGHSNTVPTPAPAGAIPVPAGPVSITAVVADAGLSSTVPALVLASAVPVSAAVADAGHPGSVPTPVPTGPVPVTVAVADAVHPGSFEFGPTASLVPSCAGPVGDSPVAASVGSETVAMVNVGPSTTPPGVGDATPAHHAGMTWFNLTDDYTTPNAWVKFMNSVQPYSTNEIIGLFSGREDLQGSKEWKEMALKGNLGWNAPNSPDPASSALSGATHPGGIEGFNFNFMHENAYSTGAQEFSFDAMDNPSVHADNHQNLHITPPPAKLPLVNLQASQANQIDSESESTTAIES